MKSGIFVFAQNQDVNYFDADELVEEIPAADWVEAADLEDYAQWFESAYGIKFGENRSITAGELRSALRRDALRRFEQGIQKAQKLVNGEIGDTEISVKAYDVAETFYPRTEFYISIDGHSIENQISVLWVLDDFQDSAVLYLVQAFVYHA